MLQKCLLAIAIMPSIFAQENKRELALRADSLFKSGIEFFQQRKPEAAIDAWNGASKIFEELSEKKPLLRIYGNLALAYKVLNQNELYRQYLQKQITLSGELSDKKTKAGALSALGALEISDFNYAAAQKFLNEALTIQIELNEKRDEAATRARLGVLFQTTSDFANAKIQYAAAMSGHQDPKDQLELSNDYIGLGTAYRSSSLYDSAMACLQIALTMKDSLKDLAGKALTMTQIGIVYDYKGAFETAENYYKSAYELYKQIKNEKGMADNAVNLGVLYHNGGQYQKAIESYKEALAVYKKFGIKRSIAKIIGNVAVVYRDLNDFDVALQYLTQAVSLEKEINDKQGLASHLSVIASIYYKRNDYYRAKEYIEQALAIRTEIGDRRGSSNDQISLGAIQLQNFQEESATLDAASSAELIGLFQRALDTKAEIGDVFGQIAALSYLGQVNRLLKDFEKTKNYYNRAYELAESKHATTLQWQIKYGLAKTYQRQGLIRDAIFEYKEALSIIEDQRTTLGSEEFRIGFFQDKSYVYADYIETLVKNNQISEALAIVERSKSRSFLDMLGTKAFDASKKDNPLIAALDSLDQFIAKTEKDLSGETQIVNQTRMLKDLDSSRAVRKDILEAIKKTNEELSSLVSVNPLQSGDIQELMDPEFTLIEYFVTAKYYLIFVVSKSQVQCVKVDLSAQKLNTMLYDFRNDLLNIKRDNYKKTGALLYQTLIKPIKGFITTENLIFVPYGKLHYIPFTTLIDDSSNFLIDRYNISYLPSASLLKFIANKRKKDNPTMSELKFFAVGNPEVPTMPTLVSAEAEVKYIESFFQKKQTWFNAQATENRVKESVADYDIIHFACHGEFNMDDPSHSALFLTKGNGDDGTLQVGEIFNLKLNRARLVVLSACQTGLSKIIQGDELIGLTRAFIYAGTPSLLSTLWSVSDQSTEIFVKNFYQTLDLAKKPYSMRKAILILKSQPSYAHPYFWGCFGLVGDWK